MTMFFLLCLIPALLNYLVYKVILGYDLGLDHADDSVGLSLFPGISLLALIGLTSKLVYQVITTGCIKHVFRCVEKPYNPRQATARFKCIKCGSQKFDFLPLEEL